jgi:subtilisin family serine protease
MTVRSLLFVLTVWLVFGLAQTPVTLALGGAGQMGASPRVAFQDDDDFDDDGDDGDDDDDDFVPAPPPAPVAPAPAAPIGDDDDTGEALLGNDPLVQVPVIDDDDDPTTDGFRAQQAVVQLVDDADINAVLARHAAGLAAAVPAQNLYLLSLPGATTDPVQVEPLAADPEVAWVELNYAERAPEGRPGRFFLSAEAVSPEVASTGPPPALGVAEALACASGAGVVVAVLDTGVDAAHPELAGQIAPGGWNVLINSPDTRDLGNGVDDDGDGLADEMTGHGTHVAGIVAQTAPAAGIMPVKVLDSDGVGDAFYVAAGIYQAIASGADVINLSLGSTFDSRVIAEAVAAAHEAGIVVVAAAGNADRETPPEYPAIDAHALGIAATDGNDGKSEFSNYHQRLSLSAPGTDIVSSFPGGGYARWSGTSMATPWVAGAAAVVLERAPALTPDEVGARLAAAADPIAGGDSRYDGLLGAGRLDVGAAVDCSS